MLESPGTKRTTIPIICMRSASTVITISIGVALWVASVPAEALGFGRIGNTTQLGQPLNFAATVRLEPDESLSRECVAAEVMVGETRVPSNQVRVTLETTADTNERIVRVTTSGIVDEPVVTVGVTLGCASKVTRKFVAFIDPPLINAPQVAAAEAALMVPQRSDSQVAPLVAIVEGESPRAAAPVRAARPAARAERGPRAASPAPRNRPVASARATAAGASASAAQPTARKPAARARTAQAPRLAASGPRLELETAPRAVAQAASAASAIQLPVTEPAALPASAASAAAPADEQAAQLARERERLQLLEQGLAKLRADSQATQQALTTLQARLQAAESERYANPLVYALAWLSALLALAVGVLWWRQSRSRGAAQWWAPPPAAAPAKRTSPPVPPPESVTPTTMSGVAPAYEVSTLDPSTLSAADLPMTMPAAALRPAAPGTEAARELSVEELIDLEQQAEFFVVLGQDEAAIELLMSHVRNDAGISPLPYLKLLEIYRRRGESDAYERIRERFNRRFNAYAPGWNDDLQQGQSLESYPETVQRVQELWASPARAMDTLAASLFRRDASDQTYDLPAYRELLFLYSIARDFAEHGVADIGRNVDLLLPMADEHPPALEHLAASEMMAFQSSALTQPLDLDVSFAPPLSTGAEITSTGLWPERQPSAPDSGLIDFDLGEPGPPRSR